MTDSNAHPDAPRPIDTFVDAWYVVTMNETRDIIQNVYIRKVERVNGELWNQEFETIPNVKDPTKAKK